MDERIARIVVLPVGDIDVERIEYFVLQPALDASVLGPELAAQDFAESLIADRAVVEPRAGRIDEMDVDGGGQLVAIRVNKIAIGIEAAGLGEKLVDRDRAPSVAAPFSQGIAGLFIEGEKAFLHGDQGAHGDEALRA